MASQGRAVFSTNFGAMTPRDLNYASYAMLVRTNPELDKDTLRASLRRRWPAYCASLFTLPVSLPDHFDGTDMKIHGKHFLAAVLEDLVHQNVANREKYRAIAMRWCQANPRRFHALTQNTALHVLFQKAEIAEYGEAELVYVLKALKDLKRESGTYVETGTNAGNVISKSDLRDRAIEVDAQRPLADPTFPMEHFHPAQPYQCAQGQIIYPDNHVVGPSFAAGHQNPPSHRTHHSSGPLNSGPHLPERFWPENAHQHRHHHSGPTNMGYLPIQQMVHSYPHNPGWHEYAPVYGFLEPHQHQPMGPFPGSASFIPPMTRQGPLPPLGFHPMHQQAWSGVPNPAYVGTPLQFAPLPHPVPMHPSMHFQQHAQSQAYHQHHQDRWTSEHRMSGQIRGAEGTVQPSRQHPSLINHVNVKVQQDGQHAGLLYSNDARVAPFAPGERRRHDAAHSRAIHPRHDPAIIYMTDDHYRTHISPDCHQRPLPEMVAHRTSVQAPPMPQPPVAQPPRPTFYQNALQADVDRRPRAMLEELNINIQPTQPAMSAIAEQTIATQEIVHALRDAHTTPVSTPPTQPVDIANSLDLVQSDEIEVSEAAEMQRSLSEKLLELKQRSAGDESPFDTLFVGELDPAVDEAGLTAAFKAFGRILSTVIPKTTPADGGIGQSRGFGFVRFANTSDANIALSAMNGAKLGRQSIRIDRSQTRRTDHGSQSSTGRPSTMSSTNSTTQASADSATTLNSPAPSSQVVCGTIDYHRLLPQTATSEPRDFEARSTEEDRKSPTPFDDTDPVKIPAPQPEESSLVAEIPSEPAETIASTGLPTSATSPVRTEIYHQKSDSENSSSSMFSCISGDFSISGPGPNVQFPRPSFTIVPVKNPIRTGVLTEEPTYHNDIGCDNGTWDGNALSSPTQDDQGDKKHPFAAVAEAAIQIEDKPVAPPVSLPSTRPELLNTDTIEPTNAERLREAVSPRVTQWLGGTVPVPQPSQDPIAAIDEKAVGADQIDVATHQIHPHPAIGVMPVDTSNTILQTIEVAAIDGHTSNPTDKNTPLVLNSPNWPTLSQSSALRRHTIGRHEPKATGTITDVELQKSGPRMGCRNRKPKSKRSLSKGFQSVPLIETIEEETESTRTEITASVDTIKVSIESPKDITPSNHNEGSAMITQRPITVAECDELVSIETIEQSDIDREPTELENSNQTEATMCSARPDATMQSWSAETTTAAEPASIQESQKGQSCAAVEISTTNTDLSTQADTAQDVPNPAQPKSDDEPTTTGNPDALLDIDIESTLNNPPEQSSESTHNQTVEPPSTTIVEAEGSSSSSIETTEEDKVSAAGFDNETTHSGHDTLASTSVEKPMDQPLPSIEIVEVPIIDGLDDPEPTASELPPPIGVSSHNPDSSQFVVAFGDIDRHEDSIEYSSASSEDQIIPYSFAERASPLHPIQFGDVVEKLSTLEPLAERAVHVTIADDGEDEISQAADAMADCATHHPTRPDDALLSLQKSIERDIAAAESEAADDLMSEYLGFKIPSDFDEDVEDYTFSDSPDSEASTILLDPYRPTFTLEDHSICSQVAREEVSPDTVTVSDLFASPNTDPAPSCDTDPVTESLVSLQEDISPPCGTEPATESLVSLQEDISPPCGTESATESLVSLQEDISPPFDTDPVTESLVSPPPDISPPCGTEPATEILESPPQDISPPCDNDLVIESLESTSHATPPSSTTGLVVEQAETPSHTTPPSSTTGLVIEQAETSQPDHQATPEIDTIDLITEEPIIEVEPMSTPEVTDTTVSASPANLTTTTTTTTASQPKKLRSSKGRRKRGKRSKVDCTTSVAPTTVVNKENDRPVKSITASESSVPPVATTTVVDKENDRPVKSITASESSVPPATSTSSLQIATPPASKPIPIALPTMPVHKQRSPKVKKTKKLSVTEFLNPPVPIETIKATTPAENLPSCSAESSKPRAWNSVAADLITNDHALARQATTTPKRPADTKGNLVRLGRSTNSSNTTTSSTSSKSSLRTTGPASIQPSPVTSNRSMTYAGALKTKAVGSSSSSHTTHSRTNSNSSCSNKSEEGSLKSRSSAGTKLSWTSIIRD